MVDDMKNKEELLKVKTRIIKQKGDWEEVIDDCRFTANKGDLCKEPSVKFKKDILIAEHSPIRNIFFKWEWLSIPHWTVVHWVRHKWECYCNTQRSDRTNVDRNSLPQDSPQNIRGEANVQHLIDTMRKRLCFMASKETRECAESLKVEIGKMQPEISDVLVPNCVYRCGCPEGKKGCKFFKKFLDDSFVTVDLFDVQQRYDEYNRQFYKREGINNEI